MCEIFDVLSKFGIVHSDIKPDNILFTKSGSYLLCDWGIARKMRESGTQTHNSGVKGTDNYLPPEVYELDQVSDKANLFKADLYAAGLLFLVCCGLPQNKLKFIDKEDENDHNTKLQEHLKKYVLPKLPEIEELITNLTQFNPKKRFDIDQAMSWCAKSKIFSQFNTTKEEEIQLEINPKDDEERVVIYF